MRIFLLLVLRVWQRFFGRAERVIAQRTAGLQLMPTRPSRASRRRG